MATPVKHAGFVSIFVVLLSLGGFCFAEESDVGTRERVGLELKCGEVKVRVTAKRQFFEDRHIPFKPEHLRLGANSARQSSCEPKKAASGSEMLISAGLRECGAESYVRKPW